MKFYLYLLLLLNTAWFSPVHAQNVIRGPYLQVGTSVSIQIRWRTDVPTDSKITYGNLASSLNNAILDTTKVTDHQITLTKLSPKI